MGWGSGIAVSCGVGHRRGSDPELLWLWHRLTATAPIRPLAWEPSIYHRSGPRNGKKTKKKKKKKKERKKERKKICHQLLLFLFMSLGPLQS